MAKNISSDAAERRENARRNDGTFDARYRAEANVDLPAEKPRRSLTQLAGLWEKALDSDSVDKDLLESLDVPMVRDTVIATASSDAPGNTARALSGVEILGQLPRGSGVLAGRMARPADAEWLGGVFVGEGVQSGERLRRLEAATADREDLPPAAASVNGWARWQLGDTAGARGTLAAELDQNSDNELASLLLQAIEVQRRKR